MLRVIYLLVLVFGVVVLTFFAYVAWEIESEAMMHELENQYQGPSAEREEQLERAAWRERLPGLAVIAVVLAVGYGVIFWQIGSALRGRIVSPPPPKPR